MSIKVEVKNDAPEHSYPCLMKNYKMRTVVLFTSLNEGTLLEKGETSHPLGHHSTVWYMADFVPVVGTVTLSNS